MKMPAKIFLIGDTDNGLTIVITDPVMVAHYTEQDLVDQGLGGMARPAIVRHLLPQLRGVDVPEMVRYNEEVVANGHGSVSRDDEAKFFREVFFADTVAQHIASGSGVYDVDFCVAIHVEDTCDLVVRGRSVGTIGEKIGEYLDQNSGCKTSKPDSVPSEPQKFKVGTVDESGLHKPTPWER